MIALVLSLAQRDGKTSVATFILAGVAINAIAYAAIGGLVYISDNDQLRDLTSWTMGALAGAGWPLALITVALTPHRPLLLGQAQALDRLQLGERAAFHAGLDVERCKRRVALGTAIAVGAVTSAAGPIGFIGLVAPYLARLIFGPAMRCCCQPPSSRELPWRRPRPSRLWGWPPGCWGPFFLWLLLRNPMDSRKEN